MLPIITIAYSTDIFISNNLKKSNLYAHKEYATWNDILEGKVNAKVVIYGSSRAWVHINPTMIADSLNTTAYNLGIDGHSFWLQYLRHQLLLQNNKKPDLIIYSIDEFTLVKNPDLYNYEQFLPYMLWNTPIKKSTYSYNHFSLLDYCIPLLRYMGESNAVQTAVKMKKSKIINTARVRGYEGQELIWSKDLDEAKSRNVKIKAKIDSASVKLFENFIVDCAKNNIEVVFVYTPEYIEGQRLFENREEALNTFSSLSKKYNIKYFDFSKNFMCFNKIYFYNSLHLNKSGSELFTQQLIDSLIKSKISP